MEQLPSPEYNPMIRDLPMDLRPRERMLYAGPGALNDAELLAIILRVGTGGENVIHMAERLLTKFGSVAGLAQASLDELAHPDQILAPDREAAEVTHLEEQRLAQKRGVDAAIGVEHVAVGAAVLPLREEVAHRHTEALVLRLRRLRRDEQAESEESARDESPHMKSSEAEAGSAASCRCLGQEHEQCQSENDELY